MSATAEFLEEVRERAARCPQGAQHTPWPKDYRAGAEKAAKLLAAGWEQLQCGGCGLWLVWRQKLSRARGNKMRGLKTPARATVSGHGAGDRNSRGQP